MLSDDPGQRHRFIWAFDPATLAPNLDLDIGIDLGIGGGEDLPCPLYLLFVIKAQPDARLPREGANRRELARRHDHIGDKHILDAALDHR
jgi:hypothetical protein